MPTVSELKDQARALEQHGEFTRALAIYTHILKHVEGTPAIAKLLPLYVKVGDLQTKLNEPDEAVAAYEKAAGQYAQAGSAQRVNALCDKIRRIAPHRTEVHLLYARRLMEHGHAGSARDVLSTYAQKSGLDRALEALDDLAGRPNEEVAPMLERLLESGLHLEPEVAEETAERLSSQLSQMADVEAGELSLISDSTLMPHAGSEFDTDEPAAEETDQDRQELTPHMIDFGVTPQGPATESPAVPDDERVEIIRGSVELEPTALGDKPPLNGDSALEITRSWEDKPAGSEQPAEPTTEEAEAEEEPPPPARGSIEWITGGGPEPTADEDEEPAGAALEPSTAETESAPEEVVSEAEAVEPAPSWEPAAPGPVHVVEHLEPPAPTPAPRRESIPPGRPLRPTPSFMVHGSHRRRGSRIVYAVVGFVLGLVVGVVLMMVFGGGSAQTPATPDQTEAGDIAAAAEQAADRDAPVSAGVRDTTSGLVAASAPDTSGPETAGEAESTVTEVDIGPEAVALSDSTAPAETPSDTLSGTASLGNPVVIDGLAIQSVSAATYQGRAGFRVVHLLGSGDQFTVESYAMGTDTARAPRTGRVTVNVTPPDTVVGILRWENYIVFASGVMPEDSLRTLMARLTEGARPQ